MTRYHCINGEMVPFTGGEEEERDIAEAKFAENLPVRAFASLRETRDEKLKETDFHAFPDSPEISEEMASYREALRNLPSQFSDETILGEIVWPVKPE